MRHSRRGLRSGWRSRRGLSDRWWRRSCRIQPRSQRRIREWSRGSHRPGKRWLLLRLSLCTRSHGQLREVILRIVVWLRSEEWVSGCLLRQRRLLSWLLTGRSGVGDAKRLELSEVLRCELLRRALIHAFVREMGIRVRETTSGKKGKRRPGYRKPPVAGRQEERRADRRHSRLRTRHLVKATWP